MSLKIWFISDPHQKHGFLKVPDVDMVICAGDWTNSKDRYTNEQEALNFLGWYKALEIEHKILIAGNHDTSVESGLTDMKKWCLQIRYLEHESIVVNGLRIFGSPYTPSFGHGWAFNVKRSKLDAYWQAIPEDTDILITHGPPQSILDHTESGVDFRDENQVGNVPVYSCGDKSLLNHVKRVKPKIHVFGHIHSEDRCLNAGIMQIQGQDTKFINASVVGLDYEIANNGYIIEIDEKFNK